VGLITWTEALETNQPEIDEQHKNLIDAFNSLHEAMARGRGREQVSKTLLFLTNYTVQHFRQEEAIMDQAGYPDAPRHKLMHHGLVVRLSALMKDYVVAPATLTGSTLDFLEGWLVEHIQAEDFRLATYLRERG